METASLHAWDASADGSASRAPPCAAVAAHQRGPPLRIDRVGLGYWVNSVVRMEKLIKENPDRVARILQQDAGGLPTNRQFKQWLVNPALNWTTRPRGLMRTAHFMRRTDQIGKVPASWRALAFHPCTRRTAADDRNYVILRAPSQGG